MLLTLEPLSKLKKRLQRSVLAPCFFVCLVWPVCADAFVVNNPAGWAAGEATYHIAPLSTSGSGLSSAQLQNAFVEALNQWTNTTNFTYKTTGGSANPCVVPGSTNPANNDNGYTFASNSCGTAFGSSTLAIATTWRSNNGSGPIIQSGVVFNSARSWGIYSGSQGSGFDFTRVAVHEVGHSLGLAHSQFSSAIMWFNVDDIEEPQDDDLAGVAFLYGPLILPASFLPAIFLLLLDDD